MCKWPFSLSSMNEKVQTSILTRSSRKPRSSDVYRVAIFKSAVSTRLPAIDAVPWPRSLVSPGYWRNLFDLWGGFCSARDVHDRSILDEQHSVGEGVAPGLGVCAWNQNSSLCWSWERADEALEEPEDDGGGSHVCRAHDTDATATSTIPSLPSTNDEDKSPTIVITTRLMQTSPESAAILVTPSRATQQQQRRRRQQQGTAAVGRGRTSDKEEEEEGEEEGEEEVMVEEDADHHHDVDDYGDDGVISLDKLREILPPSFGDEITGPRDHVAFRDDPLNQSPLRCGALTDLSKMLDEISSSGGVAATCVVKWADAYYYMVQ
ncbi:hypothetical protein BX600DRAFT_432170 [Xylariales sp. PMI_506]|nr:hypothetical protein BX600DRAFT_432170 [Xylariales sp. PMI_506]